MLQRVELGTFRDALDAPGRLAHALLLKDEANLHFSQGRWRVAMVGYLTGLWLLRSGRGACPLLTEFIQKAHEGAGDSRAALAVLAPLLKREPQNGDARRLHEALRRELAEERGRFKGLFAEAEAEAPTAAL